LDKLAFLYIHSAVSAGDDSVPAREMPRVLLMDDASVRKREKAAMPAAKIKKAALNAIHNPIHNPIRDPIHNQINHPIYNAIRKAKSDKAREESEKKERPEIDLSPAARAAAAEVGIANFEAAKTEFEALNPGVKYGCNVFGASTGSKGYSIIEEGYKSALTTRGYGTPSIVMPDPGAEFGYRALNGPERRALGPAATEIYNATHSKTMSMHVELHVQLYVMAQYPNLKWLWRVPGAGGPKGIPDYKIGVRFVLLLPGGELPQGYEFLLVGKRLDV
jgi:hypothetical protein